MAGGRAYAAAKQNVQLTENQEKILKDVWTKINVTLHELGIDVDEKKPVVPVSAGVPRLFLFRDGKISGLQEAGVVPGQRSFSDAMLRGEVFAYPAGKKDPVQLQMDLSKTSVSTHYSEPLKAVPDAEWTKYLPTDEERRPLPEVEQARVLEIPPEPARRPAPRWYHRMFKFWGNNRKICADYELAEREHKVWEETVRQQKKEMEDRAYRETVSYDREASARASKAAELTRLTELNKVCKAVRDNKFDVMRTEDVLQQEIEDAKRAAAARYQAEKERDYQNSIKEMNNERTGIELIENIYAPSPVLRPDFCGPGNKRNNNPLYYIEEDFNKLSKADVDLSSVPVAGKSVSDGDFAALAMFAAHDPEIGMLNQREAVKDPKPVIVTAKAMGFTEAEGKEILTASGLQTYSVDLLHTDSRMFKYIAAINAGRDKAADALKAYKAGDKQPLAEILSRAVENAGYLAGATNDTGMGGYAKLARRILDLTAGDPQLRALAEQSYEQRDKSFTEKHKLYTHRSFDQLIEDLRAAEKYGDTLQKGKDARLALLKYRAGLEDLTAQQKKAYIRDVLRGNIVQTMYEADVLKRGDINKNETNADVIRFDAFVGKAQDKLEELSNDPAVLAGIAGAGGSTLASSLPTLLSSGLRMRAAEKAPTMYRLSDPKWMEKMDASIEGIVAADGLDDMSPDDLGYKLVRQTVNSYAGEKLITRAAQMDAAQKQKAPDVPAAQKAKPEAEAGAVGPEAGA